MSVLQQFNSFHRMVCSPSSAQKCIDEFKSNNGCVLFLPSSYHSEQEQQQDADDHADNKMNVYAKYDVSKSLNLWSYYSLVLSSFTGLSTLLGMTDVVQISEYHNETSQHNDRIIWPLEKRRNSSSNNNGYGTVLSPSPLLSLKSSKEPLIQITDSVLEYLERHVVQLYYYQQQQQQQTMNSNENVDNDNDDNQPTFSIKRNFEYNFRLIGLNVIMVHLSCTYKGQTNLHLVEVYHIQNVLLRTFFKTAFHTLGKFVNTVFGTTAEAMNMDRRHFKSC